MNTIALQYCVVVRFAPLYYDRFVSPRGRTIMLKASMISIHHYDITIVKFRNHRKHLLTTPLYWKLVQERLDLDCQKWLYFLAVGTYVSCHLFGHVHVTCLVTVHVHSDRSKKTATVTDAHMPSKSSFSRHRAMVRGIDGCRHRARYHVTQLFFLLVRISHTCFHL